MSTEKQRSFKCGSQSPMKSKIRGNSQAWTHGSGAEMEGISPSVPSSLDPALQSSKSTLIRLVALNWLVMVWGFFFHLFVQIKQKTLL